MVGKRRLNKRRGMDTLRATLVRGAGLDVSPFGCRDGRPAVEDPPIEETPSQVPNLDVLNLDALNQDRNPANSIGRRSDCQSRKTPPRRNTKSASQTPPAGERRP